MTQEAKNHYQTLKDNGELNDIFPRATGNWEEDKGRFIRLYDENIKFVLDYEKGVLDLDEDEDEFSSNF